MSLESELKKRKNGIIIGALGGFLFTLYLYSMGADLSFALQSTYNLDLLKETLGGAKQLALTNVGILNITIGAIIGGILDEFI